MCGLYCDICNPHLCLDRLLRVRGLGTQDTSLIPDYPRLCLGITELVNYMYRVHNPLFSTYIQHLILVPYVYKLQLYMK